MQTKLICALIAYAFCFILIYISLYKDGEYSAISLLIMVPSICLLFDIALVFGCYGISGIKYVYAASNILEMLARLWDGAAEVVSCQDDTFQNLVDEWVMQNG